MNICVFGSARDTVPEVYIKQTELLGRTMAARSHGLVFGGGATGMMGAVARGVHAVGGRIVSVAPDFFRQPGVLVEYATEEIITPTMFRRKEVMVERSDAFVAAPGGIGTLDELFEVFTLLSLEQHQKPVALYNIDGFFSGLLDFLSKMEREDFFLPGLMDQLGVFDQPGALLDWLENRCGKNGSTVL